MPKYFNLSTHWIALPVIVKSTILLILFGPIDTHLDLLLLNLIESCEPTLEQMSTVHCSSMTEADYNKKIIDVHYATNICMVQTTTIVACSKT